MISAIVTAAGKNRRMAEDQERLGLKTQHKLLLDLKGQPIIIRTINNLLETPVDQCIVVLGHFSEQIINVLNLYINKNALNKNNDKKPLNPDSDKNTLTTSSPINPDKSKKALNYDSIKNIKIITNQDPDVQLSETLLNGVHNVDAEGLCLCVAADQPTISTFSLNRLINEAQKHQDKKKVVSILARRDSGRLSSTKGLGMPFVCHSQLLKKYLPDRNDNLNPILGDMLQDGVDFYGVRPAKESELININHWEDYLKVCELF